MQIRSHIIAILFLFGAGGAMAQNPHVIGAGATDGTIPGGRIRGTLGQPVIGPVALRNAGRALQGFWYTLDEEGSFPTSAPLDGESASLALYPNPATTHAELRGVIPPTRSLHLEIVDVLGKTRQVLYDGSHPGGAVNIRVPVEDLPSGTYLLTIGDGQRRQVVGFCRE